MLNIDHQSLATGNPQSKAEFLKRQKNKRPEQPKILFHILMQKIMSEVNVKSGVIKILERIEDAFTNRPKKILTSKPILVAVSKLKPVQMIIECYSAGQRHFGENYVQELVEKSSNTEILEKCPDIKWHFIGHLQTNKIKKVLQCPNIYMIQTIDSEKMANNLDLVCSKTEFSDKIPLKVLIQINSSGEEAKNGVHPSESVNLCKHVKENLHNLEICGIMTIGAFGFDYSQGPNPDFVSLMKCHEEICKVLNIEPNNLDVSMGMSDDFDKAIEMGSTIVRVGSSIFGHRPQKN